MTKQELINNATSKKFKVGLNETEMYNYIGIYKGRDVWHWFKSFKGDDYVLFDHSYSCNTGKSKRGIMHEIRVKQTLGFFN